MLALAQPELPKAKPSVVRRIDRTKVVGSPVLDDKAADGIYIWLEEGAFRLSAVNRSPRALIFTLQLQSATEIETAGLGDFQVTGRGGSVSVSARVGNVPVSGSFKTKGNLVVSAASNSRRVVPIFVGPLAQQGSSQVEIGRY